MHEMCTKKIQKHTTIWNCITRSDKTKKEKGENKIDENILLSLQKEQKIIRDSFPLIFAFLIGSRFYCAFDFIHLQQQQQ